VSGARTWIFTVTLLGATSTAYAGGAAMHASQPNVAFKQVPKVSARGRLSRFTANRIADLKQKGAKLKEDLRDPATRKKLIGHTLLQGGSLVGGVIVNHALQKLGAGPETTAFLSGAAQTLGTHFAQKGLHVIAGNFIDAPEEQTRGQVALAVGVAGMVGLAGQAALGGPPVRSMLSTDNLATGLDRVAAKGLIKLSKPVTKGAAKLLRWGIQTTGDTAISKAGDSVNSWGQSKLRASHAHGE
jgi:hypothetical protein